MTEEEKMLSGRIFCPNDPGLVAMKRIAHDLCTRYNQTFEDETEVRSTILQKMLKTIGNGSCFRGPVYFNYGRHTSIGANFFGNFNIFIADDEEITIGDDVIFGPNVTLTTPVHPLIAHERRKITRKGRAFQPCYALPIVIADDVWLAAGVTVCGGVKIGTGAVVGANSVVTTDIPANVLAGGNPCKVIREIKPGDTIWDKPELWD